MFFLKKPSLVFISNPPPEHMISFIGNHITLNKLIFKTGFINFWIFGSAKHVLQLLKYSGKNILKSFFPANIVGLITGNHVNLRIPNPLNMLVIYQDSLSRGNSGWLSARNPVNLQDSMTRGHAGGISAGLYNQIASKC